MDELKEQINEVSRVRKHFRNKRQVFYQAQNYACLFGINDRGKSANNYLLKFSGEDQIEILRCFEEQVFPELYESWYLCGCYMDVEKTKGKNKEDTGKN